MSVFDWVQPLVDVSPNSAEAQLGGAIEDDDRSWDEVDFTMQRQVQTQWCWAATAASLAEFAGEPEWTQCKVATSVLGLACCAESESAPCNQPWYLDQALSSVGQLASMVDDPAQASDISAEIRNRRALALRVGWDGGGGHFLAILGISTEDPVMVAVDDPWYGPATVMLDAFSGQYRGSGTWTHSYYTAKGQV